jgi:hypothetical protein
MQKMSSQAGRYTSSSRFGVGTLCVIYEDVSTITVVGGQDFYAFRGEVWPIGCAGGVSVP